MYAGYRYFDSYSVEPLYPFGFGLSYTTFAIGGLDVSVEGKNLLVSATVTNTGDFTGKESFRSISLHLPVSLTSRTSS